MDLENRLLEGLSIYNPALETFAKAREAVYQARPQPNHPAHQLIDEACEYYLAGLADQLVPEDKTHDQQVLASLERREELLQRLYGIREYRIQLTLGRGLLAAIVAWTAAQAFSSWQGKPWSLLVEMLLDQEWANAN